LSDISNAFVIGDDSDMNYLNPVVDGNRMGSGLIPRDYSLIPLGSLQSAPAWSLDDMPLIPMEEWPERIAEQEANKSRTSDIYNRGDNGQPIESLDQNGQGYCWSYSTACCIQMIRAISNQPYVQLSAHSVACVIKNFRDQGGWGCLSLDFAKDKGYVPVSLWPAKSMDKRYNTPENWKAALEFRVTEGWVDLVPSVYDRDMSAQQVGTCLLSNIPVIGDFNWWGHSVALADLVDVYPDRSPRDIKRYGTLCKNSWTDRWGNRGWGVLKDSKAFPNGGAAPRVAWGA
jgi:hypothetical protein